MNRKELFEANAKISEMHQNSRIYAKEVVTSIKQNTPKPKTKKSAPQARDKSK